MDDSCAEKTLPSPIGHFDPASIWNASQVLYHHCGIKLSVAQCKKLSGETSWRTWTPCTSNDVWSLLLNWKLPLLQLISQFPRPPLGFWTQAFVLVRLVGNPIGTVADLLHTLALAQSRARFWNRVCTGRCAEPHTSLCLRDKMLVEDWKALAIITVSYDEWNEGSRASRAIFIAMWYVS